MHFFRPETILLRDRLREPVRLMTIITGPRQIGKTTLVQTALHDFPHTWYMAADDKVDEAEDLGGTSEETTSVRSQERNAEWLTIRWQRARVLARNARYESSSTQPFIFAIDEIQRIPRWSETVKGLWDADRAADDARV